MLKRWLNAIDDIRREKFGDAEDLRQESQSEQQFSKNKLYFFLIVGVSVFLFQLFWSLRQY